MLVFIFAGCHKVEIHLAVAKLQKRNDIHKSVCHFLIFFIVFFAKSGEKRRLCSICAEWRDCFLCLTAFFGVDRCEEKQIYTLTLINHMFNAGLRTTHDPKAAFLCFGKGVEASCRNQDIIYVEDDFNTRG